jgi:hypothetical protein
VQTLTVYKSTARPHSSGLTQEPVRPTASASYDPCAELEAGHTGRLGDLGVVVSCGKPGAGHHYPSNFKPEGRLASSVHVFND